MMGISFVAPMVQAVRLGLKTQTRRGALDYSRYRANQTLFVKEAWCVHAGFDAFSGASLLEHLTRNSVHYLADGPKPHDYGRYRHARFMPAWASRDDLLIRSVRKERLMDITEADALAEGVAIDRGHCFAVRGHEDLVHSTARGCFNTLWNILHGPGAFEANPEVTVITFRVEK